MKRNMDLVRDMLLSIEDESDERLAQYPYELRAQHFLILRDAGLVVGVVQGDDRNPGRYMPFRLTWAGHEFIALARDNTVWKRVKDTIMKEGASWSFQIVLQGLAALASNQG